MNQSFAIGDLVTYPNSPGVGTIGEISGTRIKVDFFASVAMPVVESVWITSSRCVPALLNSETRVYWRNPDNARWLPGRVTGRAGNRYFVAFPNHRFDFPIPQAQLRIRWDGGRTDPAAVLGVGAHESGYFRNTRLPFLRGLIAQRGASVSTSSFLSSAVEIYPHQVDAALTVLSDPVQRYLLADEVGLGKTVEAGYVVRQTLIDNPRARVIVLTPDSLRRQWVEELLSKFFIDDFREASVKFRSHEDPATWSDYRGWDLLVVDEAHRLSQVEAPSEGAYPELQALAHSVEKLLLISATPTTSHYKTHLGLLHLLDPTLYSWDDVDRFEKMYECRRALADSVYSLDAQYPVYLATSIDHIREVLVVADPQFEELCTRVLELIGDDYELREGVAQTELETRVEELRAHVSETYRLHRRVIRHRRANVLVEQPDAEFPSYEVRGRQSPTVLTLDSEVHDTAENAVLDWCYQTTDHLPQTEPSGGNQESGGVLRILVSRSGIMLDDLLDTLRWRIRADRRAADRAQLSYGEQRALRAAPVLPFEPRLLADLDGQYTAEVRESALNLLCRPLLDVLRKYRRTVVFCGPGQLGPMFADHLRKRFPKIVLAEHTSRVSPEEAHEAVCAWAAPLEPRSPARLLVVDGSGEDGLNLQLAEAAFHLRAPWSPNQFEQRLGRLDRYRSVDAVRQSRPADQYRLTSAQGEVTFLDAWVELLLDGYGLFRESVSTLQDAIADSIDNVWAHGLARGPAGLHARKEAVRSALTEAREEIEKMDLLESIHHVAIQETSVAVELNRFETDWRTWDAALSGFTSETDGGIRLRRRPSKGTQVAFDLPGSRPLVDPRHWQRAVSRLSRPSVEGVFNRSTALKQPGTRLFRSGNPLTDALAYWAWSDDRGQATAFSRPYVHLRGGADPYFGFDYLVEADIASATALVAEHAQAKQALRRQADRVLAPFTVRVWIHAFSGEPVVADAQRQWLDQPYDKDRLRDRNYSGERLRELFDIFGGPHEYQVATAAAEKASREHMAAVTDLRRLCDEARATAEQRVAIAQAQAQARSAAGHLVGDLESYLVDTAVTAALVGGLSHPATRLIAAVCLVRVPGVLRAR
ncbi:protein DpdE [Amycolatopsis sp. NPDC024027]|uniref:protein DpdE n=1 Tax=Amycolatopsis sp. NPDC024027 TaxID=3154327 RepID=UPI0033C8A16B